MKNAIIIGITSLLLCGCSKDDNSCHIPREGKTYDVSNTAKTYVKNYNDVSRIIFKTLNGKEVGFEIIRQDTIGSYQVSFPCEVDTLQEQTIKGTSQILTYSLNNNFEFSKPLTISLFNWPELTTHQAEEILAVSFGKYFSKTFEKGDELLYFNINASNDHLSYLDSVVVGGKKFYSVYEMKNSVGQNIDIKYTINEGIVYMRENTKLIEYIYERKE